MASDQTKNLRDWISFYLTLVTVLIIPIGLLVLRNQRLEMSAEVRREYVSIETYRAGVQAVTSENSALKSEVITLSAKIDRMQVQLVRLIDAVKLKDAP